MLQCAQEQWGMRVQFFLHYLVTDAHAVFLLLIAYELWDQRGLPDDNG